MLMLKKKYFEDSQIKYILKKYLNTHLESHI
jgi:hypothetical protein